MTKIKLEKNGNQYRIECIGHASSKETCAAVSALCYTLSGYLYNFPCNLKDLILKPGNAVILYESDDIRAEAAFDMVCVGFLSLEPSYPGAVKVVRAPE